MVLETSGVQALLGKDYEVAFMRLVLRRFQRRWMNVKTNYHIDCSEIHRWLNDRRCFHHLPIFWLIGCLSQTCRAEKTRGRRAVDTPAPLYSLCGCRSAQRRRAHATQRNSSFPRPTKNGKRETSQEGHSIKSPCDNFTFLLFAPFGQGPSGSPSQRGMLANQTSITSNCFDYPVRRENTFGQIRRGFPMTQVGRLHCHAHRNINIARNTRRTFQSSKFQRM